MPIFAYIAVDGTLREIRGHIAADSPRQARDRLRGQGLTIRRVSSRGSGLSLGGLARWTDRRYQRHVTELLGELATLLSVGMPVVEAIDTALVRYKGRLRTVLLDIKERLVSGHALAEAMAGHPSLFDPVCLSIVEVGEKAGTLDTSLSELAEFRSRAEQTRGGFMAALLYPLIVFIAGTGVSVFLMAYVVPSLLTVLVESGKPLPTATRWVKAISDTLLNWWWLMLLLMIGAWIGWGFWIATPNGKRLWHGFVLRVPVLGRLIMLGELSRITRVLETLIRSGVELAGAIDVASRGAKNVVIVAALRDSIEAIERGRGAGDALEQTGVFDPAVAAVFRVGTESGRLEEVLAKLTADCDRRIAITTRRLAAVLEPMLILLLAVMIGFVAFATILPILEAGDVLG